MDWDRRCAVCTKIITGHHEDLNYGVKCKVRAELSCAMRCFLKALSLDNCLARTVRGIQFNQFSDNLQTRCQLTGPTLGE